jgi:hypothetical protein
VWTLTIIGGLLALLTAALCVRVRLQVVYEETLRRVSLRYLFLQFALYPEKKKPKKKKAPKEEKKSPKEKKSDGEDKPAEKKPGFFQPYWDKEGVAGVVYLLRQTLDALGGTLRGLVRGLCIHNLEVYADITAPSGDAADTALLYGRVCAVLYPVIGGLISTVRTVRYDVALAPEYLAKKSRAQVYATVSLRPIRVLGELLKLLARLLWRVVWPIFKTKQRAEIPADPDTQSQKKSPQGETL